METAKKILLIEDDSLYAPARRGGLVKLQYIRSDYQ